MVISKQMLKSYLRKIYITGALHVTLGTFLTKFVAFFGSVFVVRLMSKNEYGLMSYVENIYSYALIFAGLGLSNAVARFLIIHEDIKDKKKYFIYIIRTSIFVDIIIAIIMSIIFFIANIPSNYLDARSLIPVVALLLPFQDLVNEELFTFRSFFRNKLYAVLAFVTSFILIIGRVAGAIVGGATGVLWSRTLLNGIFAIIGLFYVRKEFFPGKPSGKLTRNEKKDVNSFSIQYMITNGFWTLLMVNDTFMLGQLLNNPSELADYKVACVLPGNISIFATAIGTFIAPYFIKNETNTKWVKKWFKKTYVATAGIVGIVTLLIILFAKPLIIFMYGEQYLNIVGVMRALLVSAFINSGLRYTTANLLAAMGQVKYNMIVSGIGIIMQLMMDYFLIPRMGVMAVAVSNCVIFFLMAAILFLSFYNEFYRKPYAE